MPAEAAVTLRHWRPDDAAELAPLADDRRVWRNLRDAFPHPYGIEDARRFIGMAKAMQPETYYAIELEGRLAGAIGYTLHGDVERVGAEVGYWVAARYWGRGVATAAVLALSRLAFARHPELRRLYAVPFSWNAASARVLEKAGYRLEGTLRQSALKDGSVVDQWMYALLRDEAELHVPRDAPPEGARMHHVALRVADPERSRRFYAELFGLPVLRENTEDGGLRSVWLRARDTILMLEKRLAGSGPEAGSAHVLAFETDDLDALAARLAERGVSLDGRSEFTLYFRDPDGHRVAASRFTG
jgi:RimJ/RimL family protein N-acetyltransferase/catechol 2,3-dioxygenase-like lactoylglutathione lyase family enzyme